MKKTSLELVQMIAQAIYDKKGTNIIALDIQEISTIADFVVIAQGNVDRHVMAIMKEIEKVLDEVGERPLHVDGRQSGDWIVLDCGAIIVHLFMPELREKYQLERLWSKAKIVKLSIDTSNDTLKSLPV